MHTCNFSTQVDYGHRNPANVLYRVGCCLFVFLHLLVGCPCINYPWYMYMGSRFQNVCILVTSYLKNNIGRKALSHNLPKLKFKYVKK